MRSLLFQKEISSFTNIQANNVLDLIEEAKKDSRALAAQKEGFRLKLILQTGELPNGDSSGNVSSVEFYAQVTCYGVKLDI